VITYAIGCKCRVSANGSLVATRRGQRSVLRAGVERRKARSTFSFLALFADETNLPTPTRVADAHLFLWANLICLRARNAVRGRAIRSAQYSKSRLPICRHEHKPYDPAVQPRSPCRQAKHRRRSWRWCGIRTYRHRVPAGKPYNLPSSIPG